MVSIIIIAVFVFIGYAKYKHITKYQNCQKDGNEIPWCLYFYLMIIRQDRGDE